MIIKIKNFNKENLIERKKLIEELLDTSTEDMQLNEENIKKVNDIIKKYNEVTTTDFKYKAINVLVANDDGKTIATIK